MFETFRCKIRADRNSRRYLWRPPGRQIISCKSNATRILLAYHAIGCIQLCEKMQKMSEVWPYPVVVPSWTHTNPFSHIICCLGNWFDGPIPLGKRASKICHCSKWVEAKALRSIIEKDRLDFFMKEIVHRFGIPKILIADNGTQFLRRKFEERLAKLHIQHLTSVKHPHANGEVEVTSRTLLAGIRKRLDETKGWWTEELWAYRTTPKSMNSPTDQKPSSQLK